MTQKELIVNLIKDDLTHVRLVSGLETIGLDSSKYYLRLSEMIFSLMGISDESFYHKYIDRCNKIVRMDIFKHQKQLDELALKLYDMLVKKSKTQKFTRRKVCY